MKYLEYNVNNMAISKVQSEKANIVSGAVNYFGLHFNFDEEFAAIVGAKTVEFFKNKKNIRVDLVDGSCAIPNEMISDKIPFEIRVICGNAVATPWLQVPITESGAIYPEAPEEDLPETMGYVKTLTGDEAVPMLRKGKNGLEFSQNGQDWEGGISGIPDVPKTPKNATYVRKNGDWVQYEEPPEVEGLSGVAATLDELDPSADLQTAVTKINEIITLLKDRGIATQ